MPKYVDKMHYFMIKYKVMAIYQAMLEQSKQLYLLTKNSGKEAINN